MTVFNAAAIQMNCVLGDKEKNLVKAEQLVEQAAQQNAKLVVLPELFNTGYRVEEQDDVLAETEKGPTVKWMEELSHRYNLFLIGCILEKTEIRGLVYDTAFVTGPDGLVGKYRKISLWDQEKNRFNKGEGFPVFDLGFAKIGVQICYEIGFPEPARILNQKGADILIYTSAFGLPRRYAWDLMSRARALENGAYVIASNRTGLEKSETEFAGYSRVVSPKGEVLSQASDENDVAIHQVNLENVAEQRNTIPYLRDVINYQGVYSNE